MLDLLDLILLRRGVPADDRSVAFRRIDGEARSRVIYFLPWNTTYSLARQAGFTPLEFLAAYEMPRAIVSSDPELSVQALRGVVDDAEALLASKGIEPKDAVLVGLSVGSFAATYLANRIGARLCAVAPSDRADMMMWQSPAARIIKRRALQKGLRLAHYSRVMAGYHPIHNLAGIAPNSVFVMGRKDPFVPSPRRAALQRAIETNARDARIIKLDAGHFRTLVLSARHQLAMMGLAPPSSRWPARWQVRMPRELPSFSMPRLFAPGDGST
jgi:pimeloyl-ACP methyl ester carboxylesterase